MKNPDDISKAYKDLTFICAIHDNWDSEIIEKHASGIVKSYIEDNPNINQAQKKSVKSIDFTIADERHLVNLAFEDRLWTLRQNNEIRYSDPRIPLFFQEYTTEELVEEGYIKRNSYVVGNNAINRDQKIILKRPIILEDFINFWDCFSSINHIYIAHHIGNIARVDFYNRQIDKIKIVYDLVVLKDESTIKNVAKRLLYLMPIEKEFFLKDKININSIEADKEYFLEKWIDNELKYTHQYYGRKEILDASNDNTKDILIHGYYEYRVPVSTIKVPFNIQKKLMEDFNYSTPWRWGRFDKVFPELHKTTKNYSYLKFEEIETMIQEQAKNIEAYFELFGVRFPRNILNISGLGIIVFIQIYFLLSFKQIYLQTYFYSKFQYYPWMACYSDKLSRGIFITSISLFPIITCFVLNLDIYINFFNELKNTTYWLRLILFIVSIVSSIRIIFLYSKFSKQFMSWLNKTHKT